MKIRTFMEIFSNVTWIQVSLLEHISLPSLRSNKKKIRMILKRRYFFNWKFENYFDRHTFNEMQDTPDPVILSVSVYRNQMPCLYEPLTSVKQAYRPYIYMQEYYFWYTLEKLKAIYRINQPHKEQPNNDVHVFRGTCFCFCLFLFVFFFPIAIVCY